MYDRKFWEVFKKRFNLIFTSNDAKKLTIYFDGYVEDNTSTEVAERIQIEVFEDIDFLILKTKTIEGEIIRLREILLHFEDIEEVQFEEVIVLHEQKD